MTWIQTASGRPFDIAAPNPNDVHIEDIAAHLARLCRFTGACRYSVAQHSVHVAELVPQPLKLAALLHDAHEAYMGDWSSPLKQVVRSKGFEPRLISDPIDFAICEKFNVSLVPMHQDIEHADLTMLATEIRDLMPRSERPRKPMPPPREAKLVAWGEDTARHMFLHWFRYYTVFL